MITSKHTSPGKHSCWVGAALSHFLRLEACALLPASAAVTAATGPFYQAGPGLCTCVWRPGSEQALDEHRCPTSRESPSGQRRGRWRSRVGSCAWGSPSKAGGLFRKSRTRALSELKGSPSGFVKRKILRVLQGACDSTSPAEASGGISVLAEMIRNSTECFSNNAFAWSRN